MLSTNLWGRGAHTQRQLVGTEVEDGLSLAAIRARRHVQREPCRCAAPPPSLSPSLVGFIQDLHLQQLLQHILNGDDANRLKICATGESSLGQRRGAWQAGPGLHASARVGHNAVTTAKQEGRGALPTTHTPHARPRTAEVE